MKIVPDFQTPADHASASSPKYAAFISYRHADNQEQGRQWASWLHHVLETYEVPPDLIGQPNRRGESVPASLYPVFRDEEELPADADLTRNIQLALENSNLLVVLCSPRAVESTFVADEIRHFKELGKSDRILALLLDGEPNASRDAAKLADGLVECLPEPLRFGVPAGLEGALARRIDWSARTEPIAADARPGNLPTQGYTSGAAYREALAITQPALTDEQRNRSVRDYESQLERAKLKIIAGALGLSLGSVTKRDLAYRTQRAEQEAATQREIAERERALADEAKAANTKAQALLAEAARSDRLLAEDKLREGDSPTAMATLARACLYDPQSSLAAEKAIVALNDWLLAPPITIYSGHRPHVTDARFSPDGLLMVTAAEDGTAHVWESRTGKLLHVLSGHENYLTSAGFSPDARWIVTTSTDKTTRIWNSATGEPVTSLPGDACDAQFSADNHYVFTRSRDGTAQFWEVATGHLLATFSGGKEEMENAQFHSRRLQILTISPEKQARLWDARSGQLRHTFSVSEGRVNSAAFSLDGLRIVVACTDKTARIWEAESGALVTTLAGHQDEVQDARDSPDGLWVATASQDKTARIWEVASGAAWELDGHNEPVAIVHFNADGSRLLTISAKDVRLWSGVPPKTLVCALSGHCESGHPRFSPDGRYIFELSDNSVRVWDAQSGQLLATHCGHEGYWKAKMTQHGAYFAGHEDSRLTDAAFSSNDQAMVTVSTDHSVRVWEAPYGGLPGARWMVGWGVEKVQFSPDGLFIVTISSGYRDKTPKVWDVRTGQQVAALAGHAKEIRTAQFSPDGRRIVTASWDKTARIWNAHSGALLTTLVGHEAGLKSAWYSADGLSILTLANAGNVRLWDAQSGRVLFAHSGFVGIRSAQNARLSPDGQRMAIATEDVPEVCDTESGQVIFSLSGHSQKVSDANFSPSGLQIVTASWDCTARLWDAQTGQLLRIFTGHTGLVLTAQFSQDNRRILTTSNDGTARLWDAQTGKTVATIRPSGTRVKAAHLSSDARQIVTILGSEDRIGDRSVRVWTVLPPDAGAPPEWFGEFLHYLGRRRLNSDGELELISAEDWLVLRERFREMVQSQGEGFSWYAGVLEHFVKV
jgi:WD40 repeat protein